MDDMDEEMIRAGMLYDGAKGTEEALNLKVAETVNKFLGENHGLRKLIQPGGISQAAGGGDMTPLNRRAVDSTIALLNIRRTGTMGFNTKAGPDDKRQ